jgi:hypothetical protein
MPFVASDAAVWSKGVERFPPVADRSLCHAQWVISWRNGICDVLYATDGISVLKLRVCLYGARAWAELLALCGTFLSIQLAEKRKKKRKKKRAFEASPQRLKRVLLATMSTTAHPGLHRI